MATLTDRVTKLLHSPQAKQLTERAQRVARDPRTRRKLDDLRARVTGKR